MMTTMMNSDGDDDDDDDNKDRDNDSDDDDDNREILHQVYSKQQRVGRCSKSLKCSYFFWEVVPYL